MASGKRNVWRALMAEPLGIMGGVIVLAFVVMALFAPWLAPYDPFKIDVMHKFSGPSLAHWAGTDQLGRDLLSRIIFGARTALGVAVTATGVAGLVGILLGLIAGYGPRWLDSLLILCFDSMTSLPMIIAAHEAIRNGRPVPQPDMALSHAANFLWMITGRKPSPEAAQLMDRDLILHAEHGSNASSFTARVVIGTEATLHAAMTSAIAALSGPAPGGAAEDVMRMAQEIGEPERAAAYVKAKRAAGEAVTGLLMLMIPPSSYQPDQKKSPQKKAAARKKV